MRAIVGVVLIGLLSFQASASPKEIWHEGHIAHPSLQAAEHGVIPPGTKLVLEDGTEIASDSLAPDDVFCKLLAYWSKERTDYRAAPPYVDRFIFRLKGYDKKTGLRIVEINYVANGMYGRHWKETTRVLK
jgi:hypothetical protein